MYRHFVSLFLSLVRTILKRRRKRVTSVSTYTLGLFPPSPPPIAVMAPRGRKKKAGLTRADAARDAMRAFGFAERLINVCIKELLEVYGEGGWFLIEECGYSVLLNKCLEKSDEQDKNLAEDRIEERAEEQNLEMADAEEQEQEDNEMVEAEQDQNVEMVEAGQEPTPQLEEKQKEQEHQVEDGRGDVGSNSTSLVGCAAERGAKTGQTEALSITSETDILDSSSPAGEASVIDYASPAAADFPSADASGGFAQRPAEGAKSSGCGGWISDSDEDEVPDADSVGDDDEIIQLTPEPLCEELEELVKAIQGERKKKRTRVVLSLWYQALGDYDASESAPVSAYDGSVHVDDSTDDVFAAPSSDYGNEDGVFGSSGGHDGPILPPPSEMESDEGTALREWRRQNAIQLEEKEKREKELRNQIIEEANQFKEEFRKKRELACENNKAANREKEKLYVETQEKLYAEASKNYWKAIAELVPKEVPTIEKRRGKKKEDDPKKPTISVIQGPKPGKPTDLSRMRQILLKLKQNPPTHLKLAPQPSSEAAAPPKNVPETKPTEPVAAA
ncbi:unnamed protein product [Brassica oleracea var. botrytis]